MRVRAYYQITIECQIKKPVLAGKSITAFKPSLEEIFEKLIKKTTARNMRGVFIRSKHCLPFFNSKNYFLVLMIFSPPFFAKTFERRASSNPITEQSSLWGRRLWCPTTKAPHKVCVVLRTGQVLPSFIFGEQLFSSLDDFLFNVLWNDVVSQEFHGESCATFGHRAE